jgi:hypothetical protein
MHRVEQVLQATAAAIEAQPGLGAAVHQHRTLSMNAEDQELPGICVNQGPDEPIGETGYSNLAFVDSQSNLKITLYAQGSTQLDVAAELLRQRVLVHKAILASPFTLGLSFVMGIAYGGAGEPEYSTEGSPLAGRMECSFAVLYRMNTTDPT